MMKFHATTIIAVRKNGKLAIGGDGQVTLGDTIVKKTAKKVRKLYNNKVLAGFAGSVADAFTLFDRFEEKLNAYNGDTSRAAIELAKDWRNDKILRRLEAMLIVGSNESLFLLSGNGELIQPDDNILAIGSGGTYAQSAAKALMKHSKLSAKDIVKESLEIAASICIYTNNEIIIEEL
ncbi:MAG: ATP-dependent protease subunit HslV [Spirochaetota bacterium]|nr:ATP-dependent protease subunit HslV [Spirochaetota bacterium]